MKLTKQQLRRIIKEEIELVQEKIRADLPADHPANARYNSSGKQNKINKLAKLAGDKKVKEFLEAILPIENEMKNLSQSKALMGTEYAELFDDIAEKLFQARKDLEIKSRNIDAPEGLQAK